jgi:phage shock protein E
MKLTKVLGLAVLATGLLIAWQFLGASGAHPRVSSAEAHQLVAAGARLVDVRASFEYDAGHLPGAINVPVQQLDQRLSELEPKDKPIVVYCRSGHRSGVAFDKLKAAGFSKLYDLGPMSAW